MREGLEHGKVNKKSGMPFHFDTMQPSNGFKPNIKDNLYIIGVIEVDLIP